MMCHFFAKFHAADQWKDPFLVTHSYNHSCPWGDLPPLHPVEKLSAKSLCTRIPSKGARKTDHPGTEKNYSLPTLPRKFFGTPSRRPDLWTTMAAMHPSKMQKLIEPVVSWRGGFSCPTSFHRFDSIAARPPKQKVSCDLDENMLVAALSTEEGFLWRMKTVAVAVFMLLCLGKRSSYFLWEIFYSFRSKLNN